PTKEELQQYVESKKQQFIVEASQQIAPLQDAVDLGIATQEEETALLVWKKYRVMLNRIDISLAPDIEWPEQPK
ncbi:tail fiber assembly protein, partial [Photorhabdus sp. MH8.4]